MALSKAREEYPALLNKWGLCLIPTNISSQLFCALTKDIPTDLSMADMVICISDKICHHYQMEFIRLKSASLIQKCWRDYKWFQKRRAAVNTIQQCWSVTIERSLRPGGALCQSAQKNFHHVRASIEQI